MQFVQNIYEDIAHMLDVCNILPVVDEGVIYLGIAHLNFACLSISYSITAKVAIRKILQTAARTFPVTGNKKVQHQRLITETSGCSSITLAN